MNTKPLNLIPSDPLFPLQWHLLNTGNTPDSVAGYDINVIKVWPDYTGKGVLIGMDDDGIDETHPDLVENYRPDLSWDFNKGPGTAAASDEDQHGTSVSGLIVAAHNGVGGVGVAWNAQLAAFRADSRDSPYPNFITYPMTVERMLEVGVDISNNSWGPMQTPFDQGELGGLYWLAAERSVERGRDGLGMISLFAAGNDRVFHMNANYDPTDNNPYAIVVGASDQAGNMAAYSTAGASVLISAPGSFPQTMVTTDRQGELGYNTSPGTAGDYTDIPNEGFNGTSAATPVASGVVALMLEANPGLGYRDVQEILAYSAKRAQFVDTPDTLYKLVDLAFGNYDQIRDEAPELYQVLAKPGDLLDYNFNGAHDWNGGGLMQGHVFGYGQIDALAAVRMAEAWQKTNTLENLLEVEGSVTRNQLSLAPGSTREVQAHFTDALRVEQVQVMIDLTAQNLFGLQLELVSPSGTVSRLIDNPTPYEWDREARHFNVTALPTELDGYALNSVRHWGEDLAGTWTLRLNNLETGEMVYLEDWSINAMAAPQETTQFFTDEFAYFAELQPERSQIQSANGVDLNAVMVTSSTVFNLATGAASVAGVTLSLDTPAAFRNLLTGDGDDTLIGNALDNLLLAGRGNNFIDGGDGVDTVQLIGARSDYSIILSETGYQVSNHGLSGGGVDRLQNVEQFKLHGDLLLPGYSALDHVLTLSSYYDALFDRAPDAAGLQYWDQAWTSGAMNLAQIADAFTQIQQEAQGGLDDLAFLQGLYQSAFAREADAEGLAYWQQALVEGRMDRGDVLQFFIDTEFYQEVQLINPVSALAQLGDIWV